MKKIIIITSAIFASLAAFAFLNKGKEVIIDNSEQEVVVDINQRNGKVNLYGNNALKMDLLKTDRELAYSVRGKYNHKTSLDKLKKANSINDLIPNYPSSWITDYTSVELIVTSDSKEIKVTSENNILSKAQKKLFNSIETINDIAFNIKYKSENSVTNLLENRDMNYSMIVVPDTEAKYAGGYNEMISYLKENSSKEISKIKKEQLAQASILFTINENGETEKITLLKSSGYDGIDKLMFELIEKMPNWEPAKNANEKAVKQEFLFSFGNDGC
jgi:hypothetical protein